MGHCPECDAWNSFVEEVVPAKAATAAKQPRPAAAGPIKLTRLKEISSEARPRIVTGSSEFNRVLGGGIVPGGVTLIGGDPGIGKSTLLLQTAGYLTDEGQKVLYVAGEESPEQIKLRADRLGIKANELYILAETDIDLAAEAINTTSPNVVVVDSIQTMQSSELRAVPGSVTQIRLCAQALTRLAKEQAISMFFIGHVTKEGSNGSSAA